MLFFEILGAGFALTMGIELALGLCYAMRVIMRGKRGGK